MKTLGKDAGEWIGKPAAKQYPVTEETVPSVYWTASGWGIRVDQPAISHSVMGTEGACISMPPEHWRATVLRILHLTESHDMKHADEAVCPDCERIAEYLVALKLVP